jgi:DNA-binding MarR family transcriptional regulator
MTEPLPKLSDLDRLVHEPARLAILTVLSSCRSADFVFLLNATGLSKGNLSVQISRLEEAALVTVEKVIEKKKPRTTVSLTDHGSKAVENYWSSMDQIRKQSLS